MSMFLTDFYINVYFLGLFDHMWNLSLEEQKQKIFPKIIFEMRQFGNLRSKFNLR